MPILDQKLIQAAIDEGMARKRKIEQDERDWNSPSAQKKRATDIERVLREYTTSDVLKVVRSVGSYHRYEYWTGRSESGGLAHYAETGHRAHLELRPDGVRHSDVTGNWWNSLSSPRRVAKKMAEHGVTAEAIEAWLEEELGPALKPFLKTP